MQEIAQVYARSLFAVAKEQDKLDLVREQLAEFADALAENRDLQIFFFSPYFSSQEKKDGIGKLISGADDNFVRFLELLAERHRMPAIFRIRRDFDDLYAEERKLLPVTITSAIELDKGLVKDIRKKIEEQTDRKVELTTKVDPNLLGGLVPRPLGGIDRLLDRAAPAVEGLGDPREGQLPEDEQGDEERDERPDHQPDVGRDEEVAPAAAGAPPGAAGGDHERRCRGSRHQPPERK